MFEKVMDVYLCGLDILDVVNKDTLECVPGSRYGLNLRNISGMTKGA